MEKQKFNSRGFVSLFVTLSFMIISISGLVLFIAPPGRVAHWTNWEILSLTKTDWGNIHIIFSFIFIILSIIHIYNNRKVLFSYLKNKIKKTYTLKMELILSVVISLTRWLMTIYEVVPMKNILAIGENIKDSWDTKNSNPPIPHAERMNITELAENLNIKSDIIILKLNQKKIKIKNSDKQLISEIAEKNNLSPAELYKLLNLKKSKPIKLESNNYSQGSGYGRKTLEEICSEINVSVDNAVTILENEGFDINTDDKIRKICEKMEITPSELIKIIENSEQ